MADTHDDRLSRLLTRIRALMESLDYRTRSAELKKIEKEQEQSAFWQDAERAQRRIAELKGLKRVVEPLAALRAEVGDLEVLFGLAEEEDDAATRAEAVRGLEGLERKLRAFETQRLMSEDLDAGNAFLSIHAGAGGTESCDWAQMLLRMYTRYCEAKGWTIEEVALLAGEEAGIRGVDLRVAGPLAFGHLRAEIGVHRLVRISPFDYQGRRHTSFASVDVSPEVEEGAIEIRSEDLRVDTYRAGGKGGQHVNVTDSAVRITHLPTGVVVQCQNERSQHKNRAQAMRVLLSRLYERRRREQEAAQLAKYGQKGEIAFGSQIRSYVLQPYTLAKDHRTGHEVGDVGAVLDGELDDFIEAYHNWRLEQQAGKK
ncbi:MAG: peptide chain release factor 2 [Planctomycetes bacterium]|nr:peptide chain release factor 2 [Planctomycetota bacterium]